MTASQTKIECATEKNLAALKASLGKLPGLSDDLRDAEKKFAKLPSRHPCPPWLLWLLGWWVFSLDLRPLRNAIKRATKRLGRKKIR